MNKTIVLTGGGTAGHIMPNIALLDELFKHFDRVCYMGEKDSMEQKIAAQFSLPFFEVPCVKFYRKKIFKNFRIPDVLSKGVKKAAAHFDEIKPDVVFSKGGFVSLPGVLAAKKMDIPYVIHESDNSLGLANRVTEKKASAIITAYDIGKKDAYVLGNPLRKNIFEGNSAVIKSEFLLNPSLPVLLIVGGSSGAVAINKAVYSALGELSESFNVLHIAGKNMDKSIQAKNYHQIEYSDNIADFYAAADLIVSRCGAIASEEILSLGKKALFIPLSKKASRGDQIKNAEKLTEHNYAMMLKEEDLSAAELIKQIGILENCSLKPYPYDRETPQKIVDVITNVITATKPK